MPLSYKKLKELFLEGEVVFKDGVSDNAISESISVLANAKYDNGWPLGMLRLLHPQLARGLQAWTAVGYEEIRRDQELNEVRIGTPAFDLESSFESLPIWRKTVTHASKDPNWLARLQVGATFELKSFMGCCADGFSYAYASPPKATLSFSCLRTARLIGALSSEHMEGEVLLPKGARFLVVSLDQSSNVIRLVQKDAA